MKRSLRTFAWPMAAVIVAALVTEPFPARLAAAAPPPATVTLTVSGGATSPGECVQAHIEVDPNKSGDTVLLERRAPSGWTVAVQATLGPLSRATAPFCTGWGDLGTVRLRARWPQQDGVSAEGVSAARDLRVVKARWMRRIDRLAGGHAASLSLGLDGRWIYRRKDGVRRAPASNEKLLLSMAILDRLGPDAHVPLRAATGSRSGGSVRNLWILGGGDPEIGRSRLHRLALAVRESGVSRVRGRVIGSTGPFRRDWWAPGWKPDFPEHEVALPTALTFEGNTARGRHVHDPERRAAASLTQQLRSIGVHVRGTAAMRRAPSGMETVASVPSAPLRAILRHQNVSSRNFYAEVLGKLLGRRRFGGRGSIASGARAIATWAAARGVKITARDGSGLSYDNRVTAAGMVRLLDYTGTTDWADDLRSALPRGGQGTLVHRLADVEVRAKTGTLDRISALSGWVWLEDAQTWGQFSVLSRGISKDASVRIEDAFVHSAAANAG